QELILASYSLDYGHRYTIPNRRYIPVSLFKICGGLGIEPKREPFHQPRQIPHLTYSHSYSSLC
ncbi:MAG: hypothetical protein AAFY76_14070, partial [Cyanobacteria bacterium J06649_11]